MSLFNDYAGAQALLRLKAVDVKEIFAVRYIVSHDSVSSLFRHAAKPHETFPVVDLYVSLEAFAYKIADGSVNYGGKMLVAVLENKVLKDTLIVIYRLDNTKGQRHLVKHGITLIYGSARKRKGYLIFEMLSEGTMPSVKCASVSSCVYRFMDFRDGSPGQENALIYVDKILRGEEHDKRFYGYICLEYPSVISVNGSLTFLSNDVLYVRDFDIVIRKKMICLVHISP